MRRVIGLLSYWDESPTWLAATIASLGRVCDHIVALDGRYALFGDTRVASPQEQADAISHAAYGAGVGLTLVQPRRVFLDEMDKRTALFQHGLADAEIGTDWFLILDADEVLDPTVSRYSIDTFIEAAETRGEPVICGMLRETVDEHENELRSRASRRHEIDPTTIAPSPRMYLTHRDMRVDGYHFHYSGLDEHGDRIVFWNRDGDGPRADWSIAEDLVVETRCLLRSANRALLRTQYYAERDRLGVEDVSMHTTIAEGAP